VAEEDADVKKQEGTMLNQLKDNDEYEASEEI
jgi:hypothetical protein